LGCADLHRPGELGTFPTISPRTLDIGRTQPSLPRGPELDGGQATEDFDTTSAIFTESACYARDLAGHFDEPWWLFASDVGGLEMPVLYPCLIRSRRPSGQVVVRLGVPLADDYLEFLEGRCRPNTVLAAAYDLRVFFGVVDKDRPRS